MPNKSISASTSATNDHDSGPTGTDADSRERDRRQLANLIGRLLVTHWAKQHLLLETNAVNLTKGAGGEGLTQVPVP